MLRQEGITGCSSGAEPLCDMQVVQRLQQTLLVSCWAAWHQRLGYRTEKGAQKAAAAAFRHRSLLSSHLKAWQRSAREQHLDMQLLRKAVAFFNRFRLDSAWLAWHEVGTETIHSAVAASSSACCGETIQMHRLRCCHRLQQLVSFLHAIVPCKAHAGHAKHTRAIQALQQQASCLPYSQCLSHSKICDAVAMLVLLCRPFRRGTSSRSCWSTQLPSCSTAAWSLSGLRGRLQLPGQSRLVRCWPAR